MSLTRFISWMRGERRMMYIIYGVLAVSIMAPLLASGFILTLDMVFVPNIAFPQELTNTWPLEALLWAANLILPAAIVQKILLLAILVLSGVGMHRLVRTAAASKLFVPGYLQWGAYVAGILYMVNPFTYSRFMAGQWLFLLGYALLPFFVLSLIRLIAQPSFKTALGVALWAAGISFASIHHTGMIALIVVVAAGLAIAKYWGSLRLRRVIGWGAVSVCIVLALNSFWLVPTLAGDSQIAQSVDTFDTAHREAFATDSTGPFGAMGNVIRLQGFWAEPRDLYALPQERMPIWGLVGIAVWVLVGMGAATGWRTQRFTAILIGLCGLAGIVLAATPVIAWAGNVLPLLDGYREPQKFVNLVALAFAYFGALGAVRLMGWARKRWDDTGMSSALAFALLIPFLFTPVMFWGFGSQLAARDYPADWYAMNEQLNNEPGGGDVLFLPWHQYMQFGFTGRIIANPAGKFFVRTVVVSDDPEFHDIGPTNPSERKQRIGQALDGSDTLAQTLAKEDIRYVLLAKEQDSEDYAYLDSLVDFRPVSDSDTLKLYENEAYQ